MVAKIPTNLVASVLTEMLLVLIFAVLSAAQPPVKKDRPERINPGPPACAADDKVQVTEFKVDPMQVRAGQSLTVKMSIKSICPAGTADLSVPWRIFADNQVINSGTVKIGSGGVVNVTASWTAVAGSHFFFGGAEPANEKNRTNNGLPDVVINVMQTSAATTTGNVNPPQMETQVLDYQKAKLAGAQFVDGVSDRNLCGTIGQYDPNTSSSGASVGVHIICSVTGARANPEAFKNFRLKHGWTIKSVDIVQVLQNEYHGGTWQWTTRPNEGTDDPYLQIHLVAEPMQSLIMQVTIKIEGPAGTNPYHN